MTKTLPPVPGELVIQRQLFARLDADGRQLFIVWRHTDAGPVSQTFNAVLPAHVGKALRDGLSVRFIDSQPDWLPADVAVPGTVLPCGCYLRRGSLDAVLCSDHEHQQTGVCS